MLDALKQELTKTTPDKRMKLLRFVTATCTSAGNVLDKTQLAILAKLAEPLILDIDHTMLRETAKAFAHFDFAPHSMILKFAWDEIDIAAPVLQYSTVLTDDDLVAIIKKQKQTHSRFIALRAALTSPVTDCLISNADIITLISTVKNTTATFSSGGFKELATIGVSNNIFGAALSLREDIPKLLAEPVLESLDLDNKKPLSTNTAPYGIKPGQAGRKTPGAKHNRNMEVYLPKTVRYLGLMNKGERTLTQAITELCNAGHFQEICQIFAAKTGEKEARIMTDINKIDGMKFIQLCNKLKLSKQTFQNIAVLRAKVLKLPKTQLDHLLKQYNSIASITN